MIKEFFMNIKYKLYCINADYWNKQAEKVTNAGSTGGKGN